VTVTVESFDDGFAIQDDGPGIDADRPFEHGHSGDDGGTGLGLAIVREIVEAHGWEIAVTEGDDGGARFEITGVERADDG
jgi:signal transduction histidine kinase